MPRINHDEADQALLDADNIRTDPPTYNDVMAEHGLEDD